MFLILMAILFVVLQGLMGGSIQISGSNSNSEKQSSYECGFEPLGDARIKFDIIYYVIGILYQIFDLEIILLFPYAQSSQESEYVFLQVIGFFILLTQGFVYEFSQGVFDILKKNGKEKRE